MNLNDLGVTPPIVERASPPVYPPIALRQRVDGTVELNVFVDEKGTVLDVQVVQGAGGRAGLNEAAIDSVKKRRYRPGNQGRRAGQGLDVGPREVRATEVAGQPRAGAYQAARSTAGSAACIAGRQERGSDSRAPLRLRADR